MAGCDLQAAGVPFEPIPPPEHRAMQVQASVTAARLRAPRAAAIAGIVFSLLLIASFVLLRRSVPADPLEAGVWLHTGAKTVVLALSLVPFAGIAFLWFIGVLRDRLGEREDRFFATVFLGSGLLFLALLLLSSRNMEGVVMVFPLWVLLVSLHILVANLRTAPVK